MVSPEACIFDLDGVIVDTAKYHYLAWKRLAGILGIEFTEHDNERLKGVSRMASLEIILELGNKSATDEEKESYAMLKNRWYVEYIDKMTPGEILPGVVDFITSVRKEGIKTGLGSASKNTPAILERVGISHLFDAVADGNTVQKAKPDPEVFLKAAKMLGVNPGGCIVFEDAFAGIQAARNAGMMAIGIGNRDVLYEAGMVVKGLYEMNIDRLRRFLNENYNE